jgi:transcriptional regulator with XRE-family HTH domain
MNSKSELARRLRLARLTKMMSQGELADRSGVSRGHISDIETGKSAPQWDTLSLLLRGLGFEEAGEFFKGVKLLSLNLELWLCGAIIILFLLCSWFLSEEMSDVASTLVHSVK